MWGDKAQEESGGGEETTERKKDRLKTTKCWSVNWKQQRGAVLTGRVNSFTAAPCLCTKRKTPGNERESVKTE